jgi:YkoY family integral membrane protein
MFGQTFQAHDLLTIVVLGVLEGLLSADNALVLAIMVRHLPDRQQQKRALTLGLAMSFAFRFLAILVTAWLIGLWWLQAIGAAYLLFLPIKHFRQHATGNTGMVKGGTFTQTVIALGLADVAFAIDSVLAAVAMVGQQDKTWIVVLGALIGVVMLRFAATFFIRLLEKYPLLDHLAYVLIGWVGVKLAFMAGHNFVIWYDRDHTPLGFHIPEMSQLVFWSVMAVLVIGGTFMAVSKAKSDEAEAAEEAVDSAPGGEADEAEEAVESAPGAKDGEET